MPLAKRPRKKHKNKPYKDLLEEYGRTVNPKIGILIRRGEDIETQKVCEDGGREWNNASTTCVTTSIAGRHQKLGERLGTVSTSDPPEGANTADILIVDFWPPEP